MPWERGVHVRLGKRTRILEGGVHWRIPFIDKVYIQTTRLRVIQGPSQTVTTKDGKTVTIVMAIGYVISDIEKMFQKMYHPEETLCGMVQGSVSDFVGIRELAECTYSKIEQSVKNDMNMEDYGMTLEYVKVSGFAVVKALRLIQEGPWLPNGIDINQRK